MSQKVLGAISLAGREKLDNLVWVVNCNLQRLDGPVRGNGKLFRNWNLYSVVQAGVSLRWFGVATGTLRLKDSSGVLKHAWKKRWMAITSAIR